MSRPARKKTKRVRRSAPEDNLVADALPTGLKTFLFGTNLRGWTTAASAVVVTLAAYTAIETAYPKVEPHIPVGSGYVKSHVTERLTPYELNLLVTSAATERLTLVQQREYLKRAEAELAKNPESEVLKEHVQQLKADVINTNTRIENAETAAKRIGKK